VHRVCQLPQANEVRPEGIDRMRSEAKERGEELNLIQLVIK